MKNKIYLISAITLSLCVVISGTSLARHASKKKVDVCKVVATEGGEFREDLAQNKKIRSTPDISSECLEFANLDSVKNAVCRFPGKGEIHVIQVRWFEPGSIELQEHCHYHCLGSAQGNCEKTCLHKPAQMGTNINVMPCPQGNE